MVEIHGREFSTSASQLRTSRNWISESHHQDSTTNRISVANGLTYEFWPLSAFQLAGLFTVIRLGVLAFRPKKDSRDTSRVN